MLKEVELLNPPLLTDTWLVCIYCTSVCGETQDRRCEGLFMRVGGGWECKVTSVVMLRWEQFDEVQRDNLGSRITVIKVTLQESKEKNCFD